ncbi:MAG: VapE family protein [Parabacteroides sp.]|nr:VapE family protein [Parabacteroides sp.]
MNISYFKESTLKKSIRNISFSDVMECMKEESGRAKAGLLAKRLKEATLLCTSTFALKDGMRMQTSYNGVVVLQVGNLTGTAEVCQVKQTAAELPQTLAAYADACGTRVFILVLFTLPDGTLPRTEEEVRLFHAHAHCRAVRLYQGQIPFPIDAGGDTPEVTCPFVYDATRYYAPKVKPVLQNQPTEMPGEATWQEAVQADNDPLRRLMPGYNRTDQLSLLFETSLKLALTQCGPPDEANLKPLLVLLATNCFGSGIPEEEAVQSALLHLQLKLRETEVRTTFRNVYGKNNGFGEKICLAAEQLLALQTDEFMKRRYELRYNTLKDEVECRERGLYSYDFVKVNPRLLNSIALNGQEEGIKMWDRDVNRYIYSDRVPRFSPIDHYLYSLPEWDGKDRIRPLADTIPCNNPHWRNLFHRWFLGMVAQWRGINKKHANSTAPLLVGAQGTGKSTFCLNLLPPELRAYYAEGVDVGNKRNTEMYLSRFALINMDEFDQVKESQQGFLKHVMQKPAVTIRKPHQASVESLRRYASFIATSNHNDVLTDTSGSRRFICIRLTGPIDYSGQINHDQLYAQAMHEIKRGERYWFEAPEEAILTETNKEFQIQVPAEQLFLQFFRAAEATEKGEKLLAVEILGRLQNKKLFNLSATKIIHFGRILHKHQIPSKRTQVGTIYHVVEK